MADDSFTIAAPMSTSPAVRPAPRWMVLVVILVALAVRGRAMQLVRQSLERDPDGYREIALCLVRDGIYGSTQPGDVAPQPTAYRPPLYPLLLAVWSHFVSVDVLHVLLGIGTVWGAWRLGELSGLPPWGALLAAALVAIDPILINQSAQVMSETLSAFLAVWTLAALARFAREPSVPRSILAGAGIGLCVLCRPTFLVWAALVLVALPVCLLTVRRRAVVLTVILAVEAAAVVAPWPLRNWERFGAPIVTTTHGGYTLLLANNPDFYEYLRTGPWGSTWDAKEFHRQWTIELRKTMRRTGAVLERDELAADARAYELAWRNIKSEPLMFAYSCVVRVGRLWAVLPHQLSADEAPSRRGLRYSVAIFYVVELALAAVGLWTLGRKLLGSPWVWGVLLLISFTAVHAFFWTDMRMRAPLVGVVALLASQGLARLLLARRVIKPLSAVV
jgi:hypothetical protein